ncbi:MAG: transcription elongation factor GreB [Candidatus Pseudothioglobus sp.]|jgi:transcription elongation factor GreB
MTDKVYITPGGARSLRDELNHIWRVSRPAVTAIVSAAAALGDRSENADYIYGKKQLRELDKRIRYLTKRLDNLEIVDRHPEERHKVFFGAWVTIEDEQGHTRQVRIVGADEFDLKKSWISLNSPLARALLGKQQGTGVRFTRPEGEQELLIKAVSYEPPTE